MPGPPTRANQRRVGYGYDMSQGEAERLGRLYGTSSRQEPAPTALVHMAFLLGFERCVMADLLGQIDSLKPFSVQPILEKLASVRLPTDRLAEIPRIVTDAALVLAPYGGNLDQNEDWRIRFLELVEVRRANQAAAIRRADVLGPDALVACHPNHLNAKSFAAGLVKRGRSSAFCSLGLLPRLVVTADYRDIRPVSDTIGVKEEAFGILRLNPPSAGVIGISPQGMGIREYVAPLAIPHNACGALVAFLLGVFRAEFWDITTREPDPLIATRAFYSVTNETDHLWLLKYLVGLASESQGSEPGDYPISDFMDGDFFSIDQCRTEDAWTLAPSLWGVGFGLDHNQLSHESIATFKGACQAWAANANDERPHPLNLLPAVMLNRPDFQYDVQSLLQSHEGFLLVDLDTELGVLELRLRAASFEWAIKVSVKNEVLELIRRHSENRSYGCVRSHGSTILSVLIDRLCKALEKVSVSLREFDLIFLSLGPIISTSPIMEALMRLDVRVVKSISLCLNAAVAAALGGTRSGFEDYGYLRRHTVRIVLGSDGDLQLGNFIT